MPRWSKEDRNPLGQLRMEAGFSRERAAAELHISLSTMIRYENCTTDIPIGVVEAMAVLYSVPFDELRAAIKATKAEKNHPEIGLLSK